MSSIVLLNFCFANLQVGFICADLDFDEIGATLIGLCEHLINVSDPTVPSAYILTNVTTYQRMFDDFLV